MATRAHLGIGRSARSRVSPEELGRGAAVVTATHDVRDAARCDQAILLAGRVVAAGSPQDVLSAERLVDAFGITLLAVPHQDHVDIVVPEHAHAHDDRTITDRRHH